MTNLTRVLVHPSVVASASTGVLLAALNAGPGLPTWPWLAWGALTAVGVAQAIRSDR